MLPVHFYGRVEETRDGSKWVDTQVPKATNWPQTDGNDKKVTQNHDYLTQDGYEGMQNDLKVTKHGQKVKQTATKGRQGDYKVSQNYEKVMQNYKKSDRSDNKVMQNN